MQVTCSDMQYTQCPPPPPRLCHLVRCPVRGFGFSLASSGLRPGQYVDMVEEGSPAQMAGMEEGDRVVEVNGVNINHENHKQVVKRIRLVKHETKLLVVDKKCDQYHEKRNIVLKSSLPYVVHLSSILDNSPFVREGISEDNITQVISLNNHKLSCGKISSS